MFEAKAGKVMAVGDELTLNEKQQLGLHILKQFADICDRHGLKYYLAYGTLLGAVRHKGFIPWDDDVDVWMLRDDYEKLRSVTLPDGLWLCTPESFDSVWLFSKLMDTSTVFVEKGVKTPQSAGMFIDIFPLDFIAKDGNKEVEKMMRICQLYKFGYALSFDDESSAKGLRRLIGKAYGLLGRLLPKEWYIKQVNRQNSTVSADQLVCYGFLDMFDSVSFISESDLDDDCFMAFEDERFRVPFCADRVLRSIYGSDWRVPLQTSNSNHGRVYWR